MTTASVRKMTALVFALFIVGGSLAAAAGPNDFGEMRHNVIVQAPGK
ncbi:hypothetical protein [Deinococcus irradiatisoli]|nr:hypothetical protein [Deinococcus irradiatisoli]